MTTPYAPDADRALRAVVPARCPFGPPGEDCRLRVRHRRERKTGPCHAIAVVRCSVHPRSAFTLYPPGHVPYGRVAMTPEGSSGAVLLDAEAGKPAWGGSVFRAAQDAAVGEGWPQDSPADDPRRRRTQGRHLELAARLVGVHDGLDEFEREQVARQLSVPLLALRSAAKRWPSAGWRQRGEAVVGVLVQLAVAPSLGDQLRGAGHIAGCWPRPRRWEPRRRALLDRTRSAVRRSPAPVLARPPPSTNPPAAATPSGEPRSGA